MKQVFIKKINKFVLMVILFSMSYTKMINATELNPNNRLDNFLKYEIDIKKLNTAANKLTHEELHQKIDLIGQQKENPFRELSPLEKVKLDTLYQTFITVDKRVEREELKAKQADIKIQIAEINGLIKQAKKEKNEGQVFLLTERKEDLLVKQKEIDTNFQTVKTEKQALTKERKTLEKEQASLQNAEDKRIKAEEKQAQKAAKKAQDLTAPVENLSEIVEELNEEIPVVEAQVQTRAAFRNAMPEDDLLEPVDEIVQEEVVQNQEEVAQNISIATFAMEEPQDNGIAPVSIIALTEEEKKLVSPVLEMTKVYHDNLNRFNKQILNQKFDQFKINDSISMNLTTGYNYDHITFNGNNKSFIDSVYLYTGLEGKLNDYTNIYFNFGYDSNNFDLSNFKNIYEDNIYLSAYINNPLSIANLNYGYIGMLKIGSKLDMDSLANVNGKFNANSHRLFFNANKDFKFTDDFYLSSGLNINFDFINLTNMKFNTTNTVVKFKNFDTMIASQSLNLILNKDFVNLLNNVNLKLFTGLAINYADKSIEMSANNTKVQGFKLKDYSYFVAGIKLDLTRNVALNIYEKSNVSIKKDHKINASVNFSF